MKRFPCAIVGLVLLCGCAGVQTVPEQSLPPSDSVEDLRDRLEAVGIGAPSLIPTSETMPSGTQRKATARDAALIKARYELSLVVRGLTLQSGITVAAAEDLDPSLEDRIKTIVSGAEIHSEFTPDDGCVVTLRVSKQQVARDLGVRFK